MKLWVKSKDYFYGLVECDHKYEPYFTPTRRKVALASALLELLSASLPSLPTYSTILSQLHQLDSEFTEDWILQNKHFLLEQLNFLDPIVFTSDFVVKLRANSSKAAPAIEMGVFQNNYEHLLNVILTCCHRKEILANILFQWSYPSGISFLVLENG